MLVLLCGRPLSCGNTLSIRLERSTCKGRLNLVIELFLISSNTSIPSPSLHWIHSVSREMRNDDPETE